MPRYLVVTKWGTRVVPNLGTVKEPACNIAGVTGCQHITGKVAVDGDHILCQVDCDAATAAKIEQQGVGVVLWEKGKGDPDAGTITAANTKLASYGMTHTITPGAKETDAELALKEKINPKLEQGPIKDGSIEVEAEAQATKIP